MPSSVPEIEYRATDVTFTPNELCVTLVNGQLVCVPFDRYPRLLQAQPEQRRHWRFIGKGAGIHWPDMDEDLSVSGIVADARANVAEHSWFDRMLDKQYGRLDPEALLEAPVSALSGVSDADAEALFKAFGIKTIGDLANNKYFQWAQAIAGLTRK